MLRKEQHTKRPDTVDVVMLSDTPGATIVEQEYVSRELLVERHRFQFALAQSTGGQNPAREVHDYDPTGKISCQLDALWFVRVSDFIKDGLWHANVGIELRQNGERPTGGQSNKR